MKNLQERMNELRGADGTAGGAGGNPEGGSSGRVPQGDRNGGTGRGPGRVQNGSAEGRGPAGRTPQGGSRSGVNEGRRAPSGASGRTPQGGSRGASGRVPQGDRNGSASRVPQGDRNGSASRVPQGDGSGRPPQSVSAGGSGRGSQSVSVGGSGRGSQSVSAGGSGRGSQSVSAGGSGRGSQSVSAGGSGRGSQGGSSGGTGRGPHGDRNSGSGRTSQGGGNSGSGRTSQGGGNGGSGRTSQGGGNGGSSRGSRGGHRSPKHGNLHLIALIALLLQAICEIVFAVKLIRLNILPGKYLILAILALVIGFLIPAALIRFRHLRASAGRIIVGIICSLLITALTASGISYVSVTGNTIHDISTGSDKEFTRTRAIVGAYVLKSDPAKTLEEAKDYNFGTLASMDLRNTEDAITYIEENVGQPIQTTGQDSVEHLADALYNGDVQAIILNTSYVELLMTSSTYADFENNTRLLEDVKVQEIVQVSSDAGDNDGGSKSGNNGSSGDKSGSESGSSDGTSDGTSNGSGSGSGNGSSDGSSGSSSDIIENQTISSKVTTGKRTNVEKVTHEIFAIYLSGSDTRSEFLDSSRSDSNIVLLVDPVGKQMLMLNTPRDYYIANPAGNGALDKLTHCGLQGLDNSIAALEQLYGIQIDYSAQINFAGFKKMIDAMGGVTVFSDADFSVGGYSFHKGQNEMDGAKALVFARERKSFSDGDESRGRHQMAVIKAIIQKASSKQGVLTHYADIMNSLQGMFVTDLSAEEITGVIKMQIEDMASWNIRSYAVTGTDGTERTWTMPNSDLYVMYPDENSMKQAKNLIKKLKKGQIITGSDVAS